MRHDDRRHIDTSREIYAILTEAAGPPHIGMRAWDGTEFGAADAGTTIVLQHPGALRAMFLPPSDLTAGEAYVFDDVDIEGDMIGAIEFGRRLADLTSHKLLVAKLLRLVRRLPSDARRPKAARPLFRGSRHSPTRDKAAVSYHYDTGNDFFQLFLDPQMVYSSAHFLDPDEPLETAQRRKLDMICRKLELEPGQRLLDIGCGWGALVIHAAAHYGVEALGVTLSSEQAALAELRAKQAGVEDRVTIRQLDYRHVTGTFDAVSSVGMFEHVGKGQLETYFAHVKGLLASGGVFLNHGITNRDRSGGVKGEKTFVNTYVFPDGELLPVDTSIGIAEAAGFELRDAESLRMSYGQTLRRWVANLEANREAAIAFTSDTTYRIWRAYMSGSAVAFETAGISIYQLLFRDVERPWTYGRRHLLAADEA